MIDPLTIERFRALADAYGGDVARWPDDCREAAFRFAATAEGAAILDGASELDAQLGTWRVPAPPFDLSTRIAAGGPVGNVRLQARWWWWSGIGIAATLAGAAAGTAAVAMVAPVEAGSGSTSFGDIAGAEG